MKLTRRLFVGLAAPAVAGAIAPAVKPATPTIADYLMDLDARINRERAQSWPVFAVIHEHVQHISLLPAAQDWHPMTFYSWVQGQLDEPDMMVYPPALIRSARVGHGFDLVNGWTWDGLDRLDWTAAVCFADGNRVHPQDMRGKRVSGGDSYYA